MRRLGYLKEIKYIYVSMYVDPVKQITTIRLQITTCHKKRITLLHCGMIITGRVMIEFTVSQYCIIKDYG
jgi:hypothetical protein